MAVSCVMERQFTVRAAILRPTAACHNRRVSVLRIASLTATALWIGALSSWVLIIEPSLAAALPQHDVQAAPALAAIMSGLVGRLQTLSWVMGSGVVVLLAIRTALGPRPRRLSIQMVLAAVMLAATARSLSMAMVTLALCLGLALFWIDTWD